MNSRMRERKLTVVEKEFISLLMEFDLSEYFMSGALFYLAKTIAPFVFFQDQVSDESHYTM